LHTVSVGEPLRARRDTACSAVATESPFPTPRVTITSAVASWLLLGGHARRPVAARAKRQCFWSQSRRGNRWIDGSKLICRLTLQLTVTCFHLSLRPIFHVVPFLNKAIIRSNNRCTGASSRHLDGRAAGMRCPCENMFAVMTERADTFHSYVHWSFVAAGT
jgi:hypothetical protein